MSMLPPRIQYYHFMKLSPRQNGPYKFYTENKDNIFCSTFKPLGKYRVVRYYE